MRLGELFLVDSIVKLLNLIIQSEKYPAKWARNLLITLHKGGLTDKFSLISNNQIGFLKGHRTADHVLLIDTIIHEIVHKHRKRLFQLLLL